MVASLWDRIFNNVAVLRGQDEPEDVHSDSEMPDPKASKPDRLQPEIIGRDDELATFDDYLDRAERGSGSFLLFTADEGSGKTYLLKKMRERAGKAGIPAFYGKAGAGAASDPYQPLFNALGLSFNQAGRIVQVNLMNKTADTWAVDTLRLAIDLTGVVAMTPVLGPIISVGTLVTKIGKYVYQNRQRGSGEGGLGTNPTFEELRRRIGEMMGVSKANPHPLVILLDDLHLAKETTFRLIDYILANDWPLLIVATWNGEINKVPLLVSDTVARVGGRIMALKPLSISDARQMALWLADHSNFNEKLSATVKDHADTLAQLSAGHVGVVVAGVEYLSQGRDPELLGQLLSGGGEERVAAGGTGGAALLHALAGQQIEQLDPLSQDLLACGALIGDAFPLRVLTRPTMLSYLGLSERAALRTLLGQAEARRILRLDDEDQDQLVFTSAVSRQLLLRRVPAGLTRRDHRVIAAAWQDALKRRPDGIADDEPQNTPEEQAERESSILGGAEIDETATPEALQIGAHFAAAGDPLMGLYYARLAARTLLDRRAYPEALAAFDQALAYLDVLPPLETADALALRETERVKLQLAAAYVEEANSQLDESQQRLEKTWILLEKSDQRSNEQADTLAQLGWISFKKDMGEQARGYLEHAHSIYEQIDDKEGMAHVDYYLGALYSQVREYEKAVAAFERCLKTTREAGLPDTDIDLVLLELGQVYIRLRRNDEAEQFIDQGLALAEQQHDEFARATGLRYRGRLWLEQRKPETLDTLREAQTIAHDTLKDAFLESTILNTLALALERFNKMDEARAAYIEALPLLERTGNSYGLGAAYGGLGRLALNRGRYTEAAEYLRKDLAVVLRAPDPSPGIVSQLLTALARAWRGAGQADSAASTLAQSLEVAAHIGDSGARSETLGYAYLEAGWQALEANRPAEADERLAAALGALQNDKSTQLEVNLLRTAVAANAGRFAEAGNALRGNLEALAQMPQGASDLYLATLTYLQIAEISLLEPSDKTDADARPAAKQALDLATKLGNEELYNRAQKVLAALPPEVARVESETLI